MKYWIFPIFLNFPCMKKKDFKMCFGLFILSYGHLKISPWPNKNWKSNKLATLNTIHLLCGALRANSSCYSDSLCWYLSENKFFRTLFGFRLKIIVWNHNKINFLRFFTLILKFLPGYCLSKLYFSKRTARVVSEKIIRTRGYLGSKSIFVVKIWKINV